MVWLSSERAIRPPRAEMKNAGVAGVGIGVAQPGVVAQRADRGGVQRDLALPFLLARADVDHPVP